MHGSQNAITQGFFAEYTTQEGNSVYYVSEVGALIAVAWVVAAYLFWRKRHDLSTGPATEYSASNITMPANREDR